MTDKPIRILHVVTTMNRGGLETMLMNYYRHIDRSLVQFDFLEHRSSESDFDAEIAALGGTVYRLPRLNPLSFRYRKQLDRFFAAHPEYRIVHSHLDCMAGIPLAAAKNHGVPVRIAHAHNSNQDKNIKYPMKLFYRQEIPHVATELFACGQDAGKWMFGKHSFTVLNNAIDAEKFSFCAETREQVRAEFGIKDSTLLLGHVGRFSPQKNHRFLLEVFHTLQQMRSDSKLLLVGGGELEATLREKCRDLGIQDQVLFTGIRSDVHRILQAMDVFLLPSLYEGLCVVAIEAQAAGLPCVISDSVSKECVRTNGLVSFFPLEKSTQQWAQEVLRHAGTDRTDRSAEIRQNGYDIGENAGLLQNYYLSRWC